MSPASPFVSVIKGDRSLGIQPEGLFSKTLLDFGTQATSLWYSCKRVSQNKKGGYLFPNEASVIILEYLKAPVLW